MVFSIKRYLVLCFGILNIFLVALICYGNIFKARKGVNRLFTFRKKVHHHEGFPKYYHANGRFFMDMNIPGFPSKAYNKFFRNELNIELPYNNHPGHLMVAVFSVTCRCPLRCRHCYEWDRINGKESLSLDQLKTIQKKIEDYGVCQIQYTGGEPMVRMDDMIELLQAKSPVTDYWMFTSGYNITLSNALKLKKAGLTGIILSLDHWNAKVHNDFRGSERAFDWAVTAAGNIVQADLAFSLSLCPTREFVSRENLFKYLDLACELKAGYIQILEPRKVGHFKSEDVALYPEQVKTLEDFMIEVNNDQKYRKMPTIIFPGYHQRKFGCLAAGYRLIYVDSNGNIHACPFCQGLTGNCLEKALPELIEKIQRKGCHEYSKALII
jgi:MoaA/NifB/PqqE/SkfB family radical SAM enzyme